MNQRHYSSIPTSVFSVFLALLPIGIVIGVLRGVGALNDLTVSAVVFGGLALFVPWAVLKLDPRRLIEVGDRTHQS